jgi:tripartite-type tricarboxylate transporter receptor subunit TctC
LALQLRNPHRSIAANNFEVGPTTSLTAMRQYTRNWPIAEMPTAGRGVRSLGCCGRDVDQRLRSPINQAEMLAELPRHCAVGTKRNAKGHTTSWRLQTASRCRRWRHPDQRRPDLRFVARQPGRAKATKLLRRRFLHLAAGAAAIPAVSRFAMAQAYPSRPARIIVAAAAGGSADITARLIGQWLTERLGQSFLVENRSGGNSNIGTEAVVRAPADGYTLLLATSTNAINASLYERLSYNFIRDVTPVAYIADTPLVMVVPPRFPAKTVAEFIAYANATSGKLNMGSAGAGTPHHVAGELFKMAAGTNLAQVQYRGEAPALADLLGAQVDMMFATLPGSIEYVRAGALRALAIMSATRSPALPEIPVMADFVLGLEASLWFWSPRVYNRVLRPASAAALLRLGADANPLKRAFDNVRRPAHQMDQQCPTPSLKLDTFSTSVVTQAVLDAC